MILFYKLVFLLFAAFIPDTISSENFVITSKIHPLSDEFINEINQKQSLWKAGRNFAIEDYEFVKIISSGTILDKSEKDKNKVQRVYHDETEDVPESFDARQEWSDCSDIIGLIRDQSKCGACWAFAAAESMSDRICIHSNATKKLLVSAQDILTCTLGCGCHGGMIYGPWMEWIASGYVTGGLYNHTDQGCKSYFLPPCNDHPTKCTDYHDTPSCVKKCDNTKLDYSSQKTYGKGLLPTSVSGEKQLQLEILKNGPVSVGFSVYSDFISYESGIYHYVSGDLLGGHAVKMLGWGIENGTKYWLIANSWNDSWGENGYFRIKRGTNECGIEDEGVGALPNYKKF